MAELPQVSVVVTTFRRRQGIERLVSTILADEAASELVIVDDGSEDGSAGVLEKLSQYNHRLRPVLGANRGRSQARLDGVRTAQHSIVLLLDDDVLPEPGLVSAHARHHLRDAPGLVVLGYMPVVEPHTAAERLYARSYDTHVALWKRDPGSILNSFWAGNFSMSREAYLELTANARHPSFDAFEDHVFGLDCAERGLRAVFDQACAARHLYRRSIGTVAAHAHRQGQALAGIDRYFPTQTLVRDLVRSLDTLPPWQQHLLRACRRRRLAVVWAVVLERLAFLLDAAHLPAAESATGLLGLMARQRGLLEYSPSSDCRSADRLKR